MKGQKAGSNWQGMLWCQCDKKTHTPVTLSRIHHHHLPARKLGALRAGVVGSEVVTAVMRRGSWCQCLLRANALGAGNSALNTGSISRVALNFQNKVRVFAWLYFGWQ